jgi:ribose transport system ATP-binding protein
LAAEWLRVEGATKRYGGVLALDGVSLAARRGEIRGLVGANGAGKSTLVKILTGLVAPTAGHVLVDGAVLPPARPKESLRAGIVAVPQELTVAPTMTVAENVLLGHEPRRAGLLDGVELRRRAAVVLRTLDLDLPSDEPVGRLPLIEQRLVMIARALAHDARLVIFDEPTATVSPREVRTLLRVVRGLAERGVSVLYVSHRLDEVEELCDCVTVLRDGRVVAELGRASRAQLVELLVSGNEEAERAQPGEPGEVVLALREVATDRLRSVDLHARAGEIVGLAGLAGSGAREVLLAVAGALPHKGEIAASGGVAYLPGDRSLGTFPTHALRHNVTIASLRGLFVRRVEERSAGAQLLDRVALRADMEAPISALSGGNQQKAIVARWIASGARVLLLDDPTAGVDVATRPELHRQILALRDAGAAVLLVSTDVEELVELADRVVTFDRGAVTGELDAEKLTPAHLLEAMTRGAT